MRARERIVSPPLDEIASLRTPLEPGEQAVLEFFLQYLDERWEIYIQPHLNGLRPDFVLLNPRVGIAVFEVKNWNLNAIRYWVDEEDVPPKLKGEANGIPFVLGRRDPVQSIRYYKEVIDNLFCPRVKSSARHALITAGVIFTGASTDRAEALLKPLLQRYRMRTEAAANYYPVSGKDALEAGRLDLVFPEGRRRSSSMMTPAFANDLRAWLVEPSVSSEQRRPLPLDEKQRELATTRPPGGFRRIKGPAGSGKSLVLAARAGQLVSEGKRVLVATYNITLIHYLQDLSVRWSPDSRGARVEAVWWNFHLWCKHVCYESGWLDEYKALWQDFYRRTAGMEKEAVDAAREHMLTYLVPEFTGRAMDEPRSDVNRYDAVLVDEGQDYHPHWWDLLRRVVQDDGEMLLVADSTQDLYSTARRWTDEVMAGAGFRGRWNELSISYRMPAAMLPYARDFAARFIPADLQNLPDLRQQSLDLRPCELRWVQLQTPNGVRSTIEEILGLLRRHGGTGLSVADVVFLSSNITHGALVVAGLAAVHRYHFVHTFADDWGEGQRLKHSFFLGDARLKATTIHSFKGYEARALVVFVDDNPEQPIDELLYVGMTRLREDPEGSYLTVVCANERFREYGRTWPTFIDTAMHGGSEVCSASSECLYVDLDFLRREARRWTRFYSEIYPAKALSAPSDDQLFGTLSRALSETTHLTIHAFTSQEPDRRSQTEFQSEDVTIETHYHVVDLVVFGLTGLMRKMCPEPGEAFLVADDQAYTRLLSSADVPRITKIVRSSDDDTSMWSVEERHNARWLPVSHIVGWSVGLNTLEL